MSPASSPRSSASCITIGPYPRCSTTASSWRSGSRSSWSGWPRKGAPGSPLTARRRRISALRRNIRSRRRRPEDEPLPHGAARGAMKVLAIKGEPCGTDLRPGQYSLYQSRLRGFPGRCPRREARARARAGAEAAAARIAGAARRARGRRPRKDEPRQALRRPRHRDRDERALGARNASSRRSGSRKDARLDRALGRSRSASPSPS